jgi:hypothetical protein
MIMDFDCLINNFKEYGDLYKKFPKGVVLYINREDNKDSPVWIFFSNGYWAQYTSDPSQYEGSTRQFLGDWECDGESHFFINDRDKNEKYSSKTGDWEPVVTDTASQLNPSFSCVTSGLASMGKTWKIGKDKSIVADMGVGAGGMLYYRWYFYPPKENRNSWVEYNLLDKKVTLSGTWSCLDSTNFKLTRSDGKTYTGGGSGWEDPTAPESTTEPDFDRTKFPLKKGSEGKEVIQLQNYLNKEIPANPLVIDGIFGDLTHNKLVQVQKNKGVL